MLVSHIPQAEVLFASQSNQHEVKETPNVNGSAPKNHGPLHDVVLAIQ